MNIVEDYLAQNSGKKLSLNTIHKNLKIKKRAIFYYIHNSPHIRKVAPIEVGSGKAKLSVFTYQ